MINPYREKLVDEASGVEVPNDKHDIWEKAYRHGRVDVAGFVTMNSKVEHVCNKPKRIIDEADWKAYCKEILGG